jgi:DNA-binding NtrC family response regulator
MNSIRVLIVDDDENIVSSIRLSLGMRDVKVEHGTPETVVDQVYSGNYDLLLLDVYLGESNGIDLLKEVLELTPDFPVIMISGLADMEEAIDAIKLGAYDFIEKPLKPERLFVSVQNAARYGRMRKQREEAPFVFSSSVMNTIAAKARRAAVSRTTVLITGESGTGKDVLAQYIHSYSPRREEAMVKINCGAIPETLIESELFGHKKGSFTGAVSDYPGKIQSAQGGTLFLDEIGELPLTMQVKFLRFLENGELQRIGESGFRKADVRIIAATNKELEMEIQKGAFREDLFYRLNIFPLHLPPLRERREEIIPLANHFLSALSLDMGLPLPELDSSAEEFLRSLPLRGNARELKTLMERILVLSGERTVTGAVLVEAGQPIKQDKEEGLFQKSMALSEAKRVLELEYIRRQLERFGGSVQRTAEALGVLPNNLSRRIKQLEEQGDI